MKIVYSLAVAALLVFSGCASTKSAHTEHESEKGKGYASMVRWHSLAEGREVARREGKPMLVDFAVPEGCSRCTFLQENVYNRHVIVEKINREFVPVWIDLAGDLTVDETALGEKYDYRNDCLLLFLEPGGEVFKDPRGGKMCYPDKIEPGVFVEYLDHVLSQAVP